MRAEDLAAGRPERPARLVRPIAALIAAVVVVAGPLGVAASAPPTTTPTSSAAPPATATPPTTAPPATTAAPAVDLLAGMNWLQGTYPSPCGDGDVALLAGSAIAGDERIVLDDIRPLDPPAGLVVAFLSCHTADGSARARNVSVVGVDAEGTMRSSAERELPPGSRVVSIGLPNIVIEVPDGTPPAGSCCPALIRRQAVTVAADEITVRDFGQRSAFELTVVTPPVVGENAGLVRRSVAPAALCFGWSGSYYPQDPPETPEPPTPASADVETLRLALIHVTGEWIDPASEVTPEMGRVIAGFQSAQDLEADGVAGSQTIGALADALGCPDSTGSFQQIDPPELGPRRFASAGALETAMGRFASGGTTGNPSLDALLGAARWDGVNALYLGCDRRESPTTGVTCTWSGTTPLQLIGLVDDATAPGVESFSILYARSAAPAA